MSLSSHIEELESKHKKIDSQLIREQKSYAASEQAITALKKEKLQIKDRIETLKIDIAS